MTSFVTMALALFLLLSLSIASVVERLPRSASAHLSAEKSRALSADFMVRRIRGMHLFPLSALQRYVRSASTTYAQRQAFVVDWLRRDDEAHQRLTQLYLLKMRRDLERRQEHKL